MQFEPICDLKRCSRLTVALFYPFSPLVDNLVRAQRVVNTGYGDYRSRRDVQLSSIDFPHLIFKAMSSQVSLPRETIPVIPPFRPIH